MDSLTCVCINAGCGWNVHRFSGILACLPHWTSSLGCCQRRTAEMRSCPQPIISRGLSSTAAKDPAARQPAAHNACQVASKRHITPTAHAAIHAGAVAAVVAILARHFLQVLMQPLAIHCVYHIESVSQYCTERGCSRTVV